MHMKVICKTNVTNGGSPHVSTTSPLTVPHGVRSLLLETCYLKMSILLRGLDVLFSVCTNTQGPNEAFVLSFEPHYGVSRWSKHLPAEILGQQ